MKSSENPGIGKATERERALTDYLGNAIADWIEIHQTTRGELICALGCMCTILFTKQTSLNIEDQCKEIDKFYNYLKLKATSLPSSNESLDAGTEPA